MPWSEHSGSLPRLGADLLRTALAGIVVAAVSSCGQGGAGKWFPNRAANGHVGKMSLRNVFILVPSASPAPRTTGGASAAGSAPLYFSLVNEARSADRLVSVSASGVATSVRIVGGPIVVPPRKAVFGSQFPQATLEGLRSPLRPPHRVQVRFVFEHAGTATMNVPIKLHANTPWSTFSLTPSPAPPGRPTPSVTSPR